MRIIPASLRALATIAVLAATLPALAAAGAIADATPGSDAKPAKITITPHRAGYEMSLASVKNGSNITGVSGKMLFEWTDACDGWAVQQHLQLHFSYAGGEESDVTSTVVSWESKDGKRYNFNVRRVSDGKETDVFRGKAVMGPNGGKVIYSTPKDRVTELSPDTIFPSAHTVTILQKALAGEKLFTRRVFDGSDEEGSSDISAFIGSESAKAQVADMDPKFKDNPLLDQPSWPIRMAFFKLDTETGEPDYEMNLMLSANGVARKMLLDYGDFSVSGSLVNIEPLPPSGC